jgi:hypothetical protein
MPRNFSFEIVRQVIGEIVDQRMKLKPDGVGSE